MSLIKCHNCSNEYEIADEDHGKAFECPDCYQKFTAKSSDEKQCPFCSETIKSTAIKCKHCGSLLNKQKQQDTPIQKNPPVIKNLKSLPLALGLNLLLPGLGYMYMGRIFLGFFAVLIMLAVFATAIPATLGMVWLVANIIMALDMWILYDKHKKKIEATNA
jgi:DNA-directed RNA polymerase subunit RPC12/RpoP